MPTILSTTSGYSLGNERQLKKAIEDYLAEKIDGPALLIERDRCRRSIFELHRDAGIELIPSSNVTLGDVVLDMALALGQAPSRAKDRLTGDPLRDYFICRDESAMTRWNLTNYYHKIPELGFRLKKMPACASPELTEDFDANPDVLFDEFAYLKSTYGVTTKPVLIGPVSFSLMARDHTGRDLPTRVLDCAVAYRDMLCHLETLGGTFVELDESPVAYREESLDLLETAIDEITFPLTTLKVILKLSPGNRTDLYRQGSPLLNDDWKSVTTIYDITQFIGEQARCHWDKLAHVKTGLGLGIVDAYSYDRTLLNEATMAAKKFLERASPEAIHFITANDSLFQAPHNVEDERLVMRLYPDVYGHMAFAKEKLLEIAEITRRIRS